jgi:hypothetical protein
MGVDRSNGDADPYTKLPEARRSDADASCDNSHAHVTRRPKTGDPARTKNGD